MNLIFDDKGNLYGTATTGGVYGGGVAFSSLHRIPTASKPLPDEVRKPVAGGRCVNLRKQPITLESPG
jgi:hypothetical protein